MSFPEHSRVKENGNWNDSTTVNVLCKSVKDENS